MPYIVKSSLEVGSAIIPWSEQECNKLMQEKKEYLEKKVAEQEIEKTEILKEVPQEEVQPEEEAKEEKKVFKYNKKSQKAGDK